MNVALWILQILIAAVYVLHGWLFVTAPPDIQQMLGLPRPLMLVIGFAEWLGAAGLVLPGLTGILPRLIPLAALGLALVMAGAIAFDLGHGELTFAASAAVLLVLLAIVAYCRWKAVPISRRAKGSAGGTGAAHPEQATRR
jgi:hypothetical protein